MIDYWKIINGDFNQINKYNELEKELNDIKNKLNRREKDLQEELEKRDKDLQEYAKLTEQWEQTNKDQSMVIEPLYFEPLTPQSQELYDNMIKEIDDIYIGKSTL